MRAPDLGEAPRFQAVFAAGGWFRQNGVVSSHPKRVPITALVKCEDKNLVFPANTVQNKNLPIETLLLGQIFCSLRLLFSCSGNASLPPSARGL
jgi:hypothetical protein